MIRIYLIGGIAAVLCLSAIWLWNAAVQGERDRVDAAVAHERLKNIGEAKGKRDEATRLDDDGLLDALGRWFVPGSSK